MAYDDDPAEHRAAHDFSADDDEPDDDHGRDLVNHNPTLVVIDEHAARYIDDIDRLYGVDLSAAGYYEPDDD